MTEENYFFKLSEFTEPLLKFYEANPEFIQPEIRRNEVLAFVNRGFRISRSRGPVSSGAFPSSSTRRTFFMFGSMRLSPMSAPLKTRTAGPRTCT